MPLNIDFETSVGWFYTTYGSHFNWTGKEILAGPFIF